MLIHLLNDPDHPDGPGCCKKDGPILQPSSSSKENGCTCLFENLYTVLSGVELPPLYFWRFSRGDQAASLSVLLGCSSCGAGSDLKTT